MALFDHAWMPGMNGPEFMKQLRVTHPDLPVVIVTGYHPDGARQKVTSFLRIGESP